MPPIRRPTTATTGSNARAGLLLCLLFQIASFHSVNASYIVSIAPKDEECFFVSYPKGACMLWGNYDQVNDVKSGPLSLVIMDVEKERVMYRSKKGSREGTFRVNLKEGQKASICLQNGLSSPGRREKPHDGENRVVGFQFNVEPKNEAIDLQVQSNRLIKSTSDLTRELNTLQSHHDYMRSREANHREVVERTFSSLLWWIILETFVLIGVATGQVMYFRRFLEKRRYI